MNGQWIGTYSGTNSGTLVLDLDEVDSNYAGTVFAYDYNPAFPRTFGGVQIPKGKTKFSSRIFLQHMERGTGLFLSKPDVAAKFPGVMVPTYADVEWELSDTKISAKWTTDIGTNSTGKLSKSHADKDLELTPIPEVKSWKDFTEYVRGLDQRDFIYRGHADHKWKLQTAFHRTGRAALLRFINEDVVSLYRHLIGLTVHRFDLKEADDYAAFLNLAQHHGFPTPMLDWTRSPFVAAYFAFKDIELRKIRDGQKVRILMFSARKWMNELERAPVLVPGFLHLTMVEPLPINNPRSLPQQSLTSVTNVADLERYILDVETRFSSTYLRTFDLDATERKTVMRDLALMGITGGSMFPGLDGVCSQLKEQFFDL